MRHWTTVDHFVVDESSLCSEKHTWGSDTVRKINQAKIPVCVI
jgi:hypothetical protein